MGRGIKEEDPYFGHQHWRDAAWRHRDVFEDGAVRFVMRTIGMGSSIPNLVQDMHEQVGASRLTFVRTFEIMPTLPFRVFAPSTFRYANLPLRQLLCLSSKQLRLWREFDEAQKTNVYPFEIWPVFGYPALDPYTTLVSNPPEDVPCVRAIRNGKAYGLCRLRDALSQFEGCA